jgi:hypothetical protein
MITYADIGITFAVAFVCGLWFGRWVEQVNNRRHHL